MKPLLEIRSIPISIEMKVNKARIEYSHSKAELEISRDNGGMQIKSRPIKVKLDGFEARNSVTPTPIRSMAQNAEAGKQAALDATAKYSSDGKMLVSIHQEGDPFVRIAQSRAMQTKEYGLAFIPTRPVDVSWDLPEIDINYEMDKLGIDVNIKKGEFEFIPGNIEFVVKEYPRLSIEYVGEPIYVPPSANPNYVPEE